MVIKQIVSLVSLTDFKNENPVIVLVCRMKLRHNYGWICERSLLFKNKHLQDKDAEYNSELWRRLIRNIILFIISAMEKKILICFPLNYSSLVFRCSHSAAGKLVHLALE